MKSFFLFVFILLIALPAAAQLVYDSLLIEGRYRTFRYHTPKGNNYSLLFALHGSGGNSGDMMTMGQHFQARAEDENVMVVYVDGFGHYWNECRKSANTPANKEDVDEQALFTALIDRFRSKYSINDKNVFAIGFSGGGHMAYKFALIMPEKFRGVIAVVANLPTKDNLDCNPSGKPVSVMIVNGTADTVNPFHGGEVKAGDLILGSVRSTDETFNYWAKLAGYTGKPREIPLTDKIQSDNISTRMYSFRSTGKPEVTLLKVINGLHEAPAGLDVFEEGWKFCKRQINVN